MHYALWHLSFTIFLCRLLFAGESGANRITDVDRLHEAQAFESIVRENRARCRIDEQSRCCREHKVSVRHAPLEQRRFRGDVIHVRVEEITRNPGEVHHVRFCHGAPMCDERFADTQLSEILPERMDAIEQLVGAFAPFARHSRNSLR